MLEDFVLGFVGNRILHRNMADLEKISSLEGKRIRLVSAKGTPWRGFLRKRERSEEILRVMGKRRRRRA